MCKCDVSKCKAACCYNVPMPPYMFRIYKAHIQREIKRFEPMDAQNEKGEMMVVPIVDEDFHKNVCPFLKTNCKCAIYDKRPNICRMFGTPPKGFTSKLLQCGWLNGKECDSSLECQHDVEMGIGDILKLLKI